MRVDARRLCHGAGDLEVLSDVAARLLAAAKGPSPHTLSSYERRWRIWEAYAGHHGVPLLPADPAHVAAFAVARWNAGVGAATIAANLSAIQWFHTELEGTQSKVCDRAKAALRGLKRSSVRPGVSPAPVLSVGALIALVRAPVTWGTTRFSAKVLRLMSGVRPRQLAGLSVDDVIFGPHDEWVEFTPPVAESAGVHPQLPARTYRFDRGLTAMDCPIEALRTLVEASDDGTLFGGVFPNQATLKGFDPVTAPDGVPLRLAVRNRAMIRVAYAGALRTAELERLRVEHIEAAGDGYVLELVTPKHSRTGDSDFVYLAADDGPLDPVSSLDEWLAVRGDHDGALFCSVHHGNRRTAWEPGGPLTDNEIRKVIRGLAGKVGLPTTVTGYSMRRSWATHQYLRDPERLGAISAHLRHASVDMTTRYIEDLGLHFLEPSDFLSKTAVLASRTETAPVRKNLGFDSTPIRELTPVVDELVASTARKAESTTRADESMWNGWVRWSREYDMVAMPASPESLALFAADRARSGLRAPSIRAQLKTIEQRHRDAGHDTDHLTGIAIEVTDGLARYSPGHPRHAPVFTIEETGRVADWLHQHATSGELAGIQDLLLFTVGYSGALRMDDLFRLRLELIERRPYGLVVRFATSKANPHGHRPEGVLLLQRTGALDPVSALDAWQQQTGLDTGPMFPSLRDLKRQLSVDAMPDRLRAAAVEAGVRTRPTGHTLRRSWATHAYEAGVDPLTIARHLRHRDVKHSLGYIEKLSPWRNNAATALHAGIDTSITNVIPIDRNQHSGPGSRSDG